SKIRSPRETKQGWGWPNFMSLSELYDPAKGYLVNDTCLITVELSTRSSKVAPAPAPRWQLKRCIGGEGKKSSDQ
ncbi:hypothetical protein MKX03_037234, partial [Papaver bracteatum]